MNERARRLLTLLLLLWLAPLTAGAGGGVPEAHGWIGTTGPDGGFYAR